MHKLVDADLVGLILSFVLHVHAMHVLSRVSREWARAVSTPQAWAMSNLSIDKCNIDALKWGTHAHMWRFVASLSVTYAQTLYASLTGIPRYVSWSWGAWHLRRQDPCSWTPIPFVWRLDGLNFCPWVCLSAQPMAPKFSVLLSVHDPANPPISVGWTNAANPRQLARVFFDEGTRLCDLHVFILYVNLIPPHSFFTEQTLVVRMQSGAGLHYVRIPSAGVSVLGSESCHVELKAYAVISLCCEQNGNNVEVYINGVLRATIPCPIRLGQSPGWPPGVLSSNRVFALTMSNQQPHIELLPKVSAG